MIIDVRVLDGVQHLKPADQRYMLCWLKLPPYVHDRTSSFASWKLPRCEECERVYQLIVKRETERQAEVCQVCGEPATDQQFWGSELVHSYCELHGQAAAANHREVLLELYGSAN